MRNTSDKSQKDKHRGFRFTIGTTLLWLAIAGLVANTIVINWRITMLQREIDDQQRELNTHRPLPPQEVASQFEKRTTLGPITTSVKDVRYSPDTDSYKVEFTWINSTTGKTWQTDVELESDGYGAYFGQIRNGPFIKPLGYEESFAILVEAPSPLAAETRQGP